ncbi:MAG: tRNA epoxyqueuosine(34) reductase QueG [Actinobacteria bacterium]|nr:tRNA epoxyqueuosine(34) reductase QueG [Actinomycetota bacterium]MSX14724.1 tRNA epoxyqueuosine(34) reductase QueG [Actinomycetota bacterium]MSX37351.1 tRNA epoxyqueuosine(34) reductase QueG [Actinomycetota bacterium]MUH55357.1 tRNA epoxyqueuosine(34) reductase QueG [Actinomycetota bacterium]
MVHRVKRNSPPVDTTDPAYLESLLHFARELGLDRVGVTDASPLSRARVAIDDRKARGLSDTMGFTYRNPSRSTDPNTAVEGARSIIVAARSYHSDQPDHPGGISARVARYAQDDHYTPLRQALQKIALRLRADGYRAVVFADENNLVDREVAYRAGLGWFGKNANILLPGAGSFFSLGSIVTTAVLAPAAQPAPDGCGTCRACYDECPTQAIVADGVIDARRCLAWLVQKSGNFPREFRVALGDRLYGCDDCQTSCPPTVRLHSRHQARIAPVAGPGAFVDVIELLNSSNESLLDKFGSWYLAERDPRWLRRNALIILGNIAPVNNSALDNSVMNPVEQLLRRYLGDIDPMLRLHALWAAVRLGRRDLVESLALDTDESVRDEYSQIESIPVRTVAS